MAKPSTTAQHVFEIRIRGSIQMVWEEITKRGAVQRAVMDTVFISDLKPGSPFRYTSPNGKYTMVYGEILEIDPPRRLVHTYQFSLHQDPPSRVTWELEQVGEEVRVHLLHDQLVTGSKTEKQISGGWKSILGNLKLVIENGDIGFGTKAMYFVMYAMLPLMAKKDAGK